MQHVILCHQFFSCLPKSSKVHKITQFYKGISMQVRQWYQVLSIIVFASLCLSACKCQQNAKPAPPPTTAQPVPLFLSEGVLWVKKTLGQYPEINWLVVTNVPQPQGAQINADHSYSEQLYSQKSIEFDRTLMSLYSLKLILDGTEKAYQEFTAAQPENIRLTKESFQSLHEQTKKLINSNYQGLNPAQMQQALETAVVLGWMGKSEHARKIFSPFGATAPVNTDFYGQMLDVLKNQPRLARSFARLPYAGKQLLLKAANLADYGQITHLEGGPSLLTKLKESDVPETDLTALSFDLLVHTCVFAGSMGEAHKTSSMAYTQQTHQTLQAVSQACHLLSDSDKTEADAYDSYLAVRASWLGFNASDPEDRVLTRIGALLKLFTSEEGAALKNAISQLSPDDRMRIFTQFDVLSGKEQNIPGVLASLYNNQFLAEIPTTRISQAVVFGLPFIARVLEQRQAEISLNFNQVAEIAKTMPDLLLTKQFKITSDGNVVLL
jgi:hypothetical protein